MTTTFHSFEFIRKSKNRNVFDFSCTENLIILQGKYITTLIKAQYDNAYQLRKCTFIFVVGVIKADRKTIFNYATFCTNQR